MPTLKARMLFRVLFSLADSNEIIDGDPFPQGKVQLGALSTQLWFQVQHNLLVSID